MWKLRGAARLDRAAPLGAPWHQCINVHQNRPGSATVRGQRLGSESASGVSARIIAFIGKWHGRSYGGNTAGESGRCHGVSSRRCVSFDGLERREILDTMGWWSAWNNPDGMSGGTLLVPKTLERQSGSLLPLGRSATMRALTLLIRNASTDPKARSDPKAR